MYATDRHTDRRQTASSLNAPAYEGRGRNKDFRLVSFKTGPPDVEIRPDDSQRFEEKG